MFFDFAQLALFFAAPPIAGRSIARSFGAGLLVACGLVFAWFAPGTPVERGLRAFLAGGCLMIVMKITSSSRENPAQLWRLPRALCPFRVPPELSWRIAGTLLLNLLLAGTAVVMLVRLPRPLNGISHVTRLAAGVLLLYCGAQLVFDTARFGFRACGWSVDALHRTPIAARTVSEFWSRRWNGLVSDWLHQFAFLPLARRDHPRLGILWAFLVSGLLHGWPILVALGIRGAIAVTAFFVIQGVLVLAEHKLRVHAWPAAAAHTWTVIILLGSSPLLIDPELKVFGF